MDRHAADVQRIFSGNAAAGLVSGQEMIRGQVALQGTALAGVPLVNVENACASGSSAFNLATMALRAGSCDIALAVGVEKMNIPDKAKMFSAFDGGWDVSTVAQNKETLMVMGEGIVPLRRIVEVLKRKQYAGTASLEMFNPAIQAMDPYQVAMKARATIEPLIAQTRA